MDRKTVEAFFENRCTKEEARRVLEWFDSPEGQAYLQQRIDKDIDKVSGAHLPLETQDLNSDDLYQKINNRINQSVAGTGRIRHLQAQRLSPVVKVAAILLVVFASAYVVSRYTYELNAEATAHTSEDQVFRTGAEQQKKLTLQDGSRIRLNNRSELRITKGFADSVRRVELRGEAYFQVAHNPARPFIIEVNNTLIQVLGTSFNVKSMPEQKNVQVAVEQGRVSVENRSSAGVSKVELTQGQLGYVDLNRAEIKVESIQLDNYLSWINGRLVFSETPMNEVCTQLSRIYGAEFHFGDETLERERLSADFERESLGKTLSVISLTMDMEYRRDGEQITWFR